METVTQNVKTVLLMFQLIAFNLEERTGKLLLKTGGRQKTFNVSLSPLVAYYLANDFVKTFEEEVTKMKFTSTLRSPEFKENPFRLVKYADGNYGLYLVSEAKPKLKYHTCPVTGDTFKEYINQYTPKKKFLRYIDASVKRS